VTAALLAGVATGCLVAAVGLRREPTLLADLVPDRRRRGSVLHAVGSLPLLRRVGVSERARARLAATGTTERELVGAQALAAVLAMCLIAAVGALVLAPALVLLAVRVPEIWLARAVARRRAAASREVPVLLDLLAVATSAGLPPQLAFRRAVEAAEGPLADELRRAIVATDLGGRWRDELEAAAGRLGLPDLSRAVAALTRSATLGSSLAEEIERLAADVREARRSAATERARAAPVKMLFPLVFLKRRFVGP
jgi:tight adherence protein C